LVETAGVESRYDRPASGKSMTSETAAPTVNVGSAAALTPVGAGERIAAVDTLRGVALFGILLLNITAFALPGAAYSDPGVAGGDSGLNHAWWLVSQILFEGKMRTLFSMLFGASVVLLTARAEERGAGARIADIYYRRTIWLIVFGMLHAYFIWSGDILYSYGVAGLFLFPFRRRPARFLIAAGLAVLAIGVPKTILEGRRIEAVRAKAEMADRITAAGGQPSDEQVEARDEWRMVTRSMQPTPAQIQKELTDHRGPYRGLFLSRMEDVSYEESRGFYRFGFIDVAGMMLLGMGLLKLGVLSAVRSPRFYTLLALAGYGIGIPINVWMALHDAAHDFDPAQMFVAWTGYDLGRLAVTLGHVGMIMLAVKSGILPWLSSRLAAVGQMALTNYLTTSILCTTIFEGYGFGLFGRLQRAQLLLVVAPIWTAQLLWSRAWLRHFRFGPMEWVWRSLTYWRPQPMRLAAERIAMETRPAAAAPDGGA
jgi:uncharacterized protein